MKNLIKKVRHHSKKITIYVKSQPKWVVRCMFGIGAILGLVLSLHTHPIGGTNAQSECPEGQYLATGDVCITNEKDIVIQATATEANQRLTINKYFANDFTVDRGDGTTGEWATGGWIYENIISHTTHTYGVTGTYNITLSLSGVDRWTFQEMWGEISYKEPLVPVSGTTVTDVQIIYMPSLTEGFGDSAEVPGDRFFSYFNNNGALTSLPIGSFNTSQITTAGDLFFFGFNCNGKLTSLPIGSFNISNISGAVGDNFFSYFNNNGALTSLPIGSFNTSQITTAGDNFFSRFDYSGALTSLPEGSFNISNISGTVGGGFFSYFNTYGQLTSLPTNSFDTSNITSAGDSFFVAFNSNGALTSLPEGSFNISQITTAGDLFFTMFNSRGALTSLPVESFDTSNITSAGFDFFHAFNYNGKLTSLPEGSFNTSKINGSVGQDFFSYFNYSGNLTSLPEGSFDISNIATVGDRFFSYFNSNGALTSLPDSFTLNSTGAQSVSGYMNAFYSPNYTLNKRVSDLVSGIVAPLDYRNTFSSNQPGRCGVHENWLKNKTNACSISYDNKMGGTWEFKYDADTTGVVAGSGITVPTASDYSFEGRYTASGVKIDEVIFPQLDGQTLYAKWIDDISPTCDVTYDITGITTGNVVASLTDCSEDITGTNLQHTFTENGTYTFRFQDLAGNTGELEAYVDWIDVTGIVLNDKNVKSICKATQNQANRILNCSGKAIVDIKPGTFNSLDDITSIILSSNRLSIIKSGVFDGLNNLKYIDFTSNNISGIEIQSFKNLDNLDSIWFNDNLISSFNSDIIMSCDNLHYISLYNNKIKSIDNGTFGGLNNLTSIHLSNNEIDSVASNTFNGLSNLVYINLGGNKLKAINPNLFNGLLKLEGIYLDNNELTGLDVGTFSGLNNLIHLYLNSNKIESVSSGVFDGLSSLKFLHLEENNIRDIEIGALNPLENLGTLNLGQNQITNINRRNFNGLDKLSYLLLNNNCLSQNINDILPRINLITTSNQKLCFSPIYEYYGDHAIAKLDLTGNANLYNRYHDYFNLNKTIEFTSTGTEYFDVSERSGNSIFINAGSGIIYYPVDGKVAATVNSFNGYNSVDAGITFSISVDDNISSGKYIEFTVKVVKNGLTYKDYTDKIMIVLTDKRGNLIDDNLYDVYNNGIYEFTQSDRGRKTFTNRLKIKKEGTYKLKVFDLNNHEGSEIIVVGGSHNAANFEYDTLKFNPNYSDEMNKAYQFSRYFKITTKNSIKDANMYGGLNRVAMAKMLTNYAENVLGIDDFDTSRNCTFKDVSVALDKEYNNGVTKACQLGIMGVNAKDNNFNPYGTVTRAQFATALSRLLYGTKDGTDNYYSTHISKLYREGIITKTDPTLKELRGYVMLMLMRAGK